MEININFKDSTIVVDGYGCHCELIEKQEDNWISMEIRDGKARLYIVGEFRDLEEFSFADPWIKYNRLLLQEERNAEAAAEAERQQTLAAIEANNALAEDMLVQAAQAEAAGKTENLMRYYSKDEIDKILETLVTDMSQPEVPEGWTPTGPASP